MAYALRDFRYYDFARKVSIEVKRGDEVKDIAAHVDLEKLGRTKYVDLEAEGTERTLEPVKKRGRPKKA